MSGLVPPRRFESGDPIRASDMNLVGASLLQRLTVIGSQVYRYGSSVSVIPKDAATRPAAFTPTAVVRMKVTTEKDDFLSCKIITGGSATGSVIKVAKPPELRGDTGTRSVGGESQSIFPAYGSAEIWADQPSGGTGVSDPVLDENGNPVLDMEGNPVTDAVLWMDTNRSARRWATTCPEP